MQIELKHGAGGAATDALIGSLFARYFKNKVLGRMEDAAVLPEIQGSPVLTTDSFVVTPLFFPGGDIGRLSVCGTVNDLACMGAVPLYLTAGFILEEGLELEILEKIVASMAAAAREAGVTIVAGDTKVIERRSNPGTSLISSAAAKNDTDTMTAKVTETSAGLFINTSGLGVRPVSCRVGASQLVPGDSILVTGSLGDHHGTILAARLGLQSDLRSDCAPLQKLVAALLDGGIQVHAVRDMTRGGLATVANELAVASRCRITLQENLLPVHAGVISLCGLLGLEPYTMGNEGKMLLAVPAAQAATALQILRSQTYGKEAALVGEVQAGKGVYLETILGGLRNLPPLRGEGLPRIC